MMRLPLLFLALWLVAEPACAAPGGRDAVGFSGTWRLESVTDGKRTRRDLDERLTLSLVEGLLELDYWISDRFGSRKLSLRAPLDGTPLPQTVDSRRAVVTARLDGERLVLGIERDAPFGHVRNVRNMLLAADGRRIDSYRENFRENGDRHSSWQETWARVE